jgi:hypothetical protein
MKNINGKNNKDLLNMLTVISEMTTAALKWSIYPFLLMALSSKNS